MQGFPDNFSLWGMFPDRRFGSKLKQVSDTQRYRLLGNAVSVPVAEFLGRRLMAQGVDSKLS